MVDGLYQRTQLLIGSEGVERLKKARVLVCGLGGVGGYAVEALARAGVGTLGLCDMDRLDPSNLNRQILALQSTIGRLKAEVAEERVREINPDACVRTFAFRITNDNLHELDIASWDCIADCIDDVPAKTALICEAKRLGVRIVSSMGTGNKLDASGFMVSDIAKTEHDRLAKSLRKRLRDAGVTGGVNVVYSKEAPVAEVTEAIPSISYTPGTAGLMIAGEVIKGLL